MKNGVQLDNRFVVPHNVDLIVKFQSHTNVEVCNQTKAVKYFFKYVARGSDNARVVLESSNKELKMLEMKKECQST